MGINDTSLTIESSKILEHAIKLYLDQPQDGFSADYCESTLEIVYKVMSLYFDENYVGNFCCDLRDCREVILGNKPPFLRTCEPPAFAGYLVSDYYA